MGATSFGFVILFAGFTFGTVDAAAVSWEEALGRTLQDMAPQVQSQMQTNAESRQHAEIMRRVRLIQMESGPYRRKAMIMELVNDPSLTIPQEIFEQYVLPLARSTAREIQDLGGEMNAQMGANDVAATRYTETQTAEQRNPDTTDTAAVIGNILIIAGLLVALAFVW